MTQAFFFRLLIGVVFILTLSHCSLFKKSISHPQNLTPEARAKYLQRVDYWALTGRIGIITPDESNSANIFWEKHDEKITLRIYGALGTTYALLTATPGNAKIELSDDTVMTGNDPQMLLWQATGWTIPVEQLQFWILGLHTTGQSAKNNQEGYLSSLVFQEWQMTIQRYDTYAGLVMPRKIRIKHPDITLKFSVHDWEFTPND